MKGCKICDCHMDDNHESDICECCVDDMVSDYEDGLP